MKDIKIPKSNSEEQEITALEKNMVIVGANGAGKTRFGSKLEQINSPTKRISAQRYLQLTEVVQRQDYETSESQLRSVFKNQSPIQPQNDYQQVLISLFAEESKRNEGVISTINSKGQITKEETPNSTKEKVLEVWNFIFPYRTLKLEKDKVRADDFSGTEMSDGEKVGLYLISQILLAEKDCILIVDEPELHLHKALMVRLWNKLEECRSDCTFVYITHDLDFAVSKPTSKLIWIQSFKNNLWDWKEIDLNEIIPEDLFLEILGSRKPILFVEGDRGSLDIQIYQAYYENFTVIPCGSCEKVIEAVRGLKSHADLHDKKVFGIIDRDFRTDEQLTALKKDGIFSTTLNEIENLFLVPEIVDIVCAHLSKVDKKEEIISEIKRVYTGSRADLVFVASKFRMHRHLGEKFGSM
jgi:ABC-type cobalamin/Fe3+-siderophores transport system ATPase subunit